MFTIKSLASILIAALILGFSLSLVSNLNGFSTMFFIILLIILGNIIAKEMAAYYYDLKIEHKFLEIKRYWVGAHDHFKNPFPIGAVLPIITVMLSAGYFVWLNILYFDSKAEIYRVAKRRGFYKYSESSELHEGLVAFYGVIGTIILGVVGLLIGFPEFTRFSFFYAFFNTIPIGKLDGNKILFSNITLWATSIIVTLALSVIAILFI